MDSPKDNSGDKFHELILREVGRLKQSQRDEVYELKGKLRELCDSSTSKSVFRYAVCLLAEDLRKEE